MAQALTLQSYFCVKKEQRFFLNYASFLNKCRHVFHFATGKQYISDLGVKVDQAQVLTLKMHSVLEFT